MKKREIVELLGKPVMVEVRGKLQQGIVTNLWKVNPNLVIAKVQTSLWTVERPILLT